MKERVKKSKALFTKNKMISQLYKKILQIKVLNNYLKTNYIDSTRIYSANLK